MDLKNMKPNLEKPSINQSDNSSGGVSKKAMFYSLSILSGIFIGTSYIPFPPWAIFFAFIPLWYLWVKNPNMKSVWWSGWICQFVLTLIGFNWVAHTINEFGHMPLWAAYIALFGFCSFSSLHIPLAGVAWCFLVKKFKLSPAHSVVFIPAFIWIFESFYPMIFDWHFGYTWLWAGFPAFHLAEWVGFKGLSLITIFANLLLYFAVFTKTKKRWVFVAAFALGFLILNSIGMGLQKRLPAYDKQTSALIVQANIGNLEKQYAFKGIGFRDSILDQYIELTKQGLAENPNVDFAIWPETAFPDVFNKPGYYSKYVMRLRSFLNQNNLNLITGSYGVQAQTGQITNSLFFLTPGELGQDLKAYTKTVLLAFGEYIPGAGLFPKLKEWLPQVADFARGEGPSRKSYLGINFGPQICYEGLFDWFTRDLARLGAEVVVNVTNDSWYGTWQQPYQHLYMTLARAIEIRRPLIRSTNTGISTVVLAHGEVLEKSPLETVWQGRYDIPYWSKGPKTLFTGWGYWIPLLFVLAWMSFWLIRMKRREAKS